mgnify:CR=1 FL=1
MGSQTAWFHSPAGMRAAEAEVLRAPVPEPEGPPIRVMPAELARRLSRGDTPRIIDLREPEEFRRCHLHGALNIPLWRLETVLDRLDPAREVVLICGSGSRSLGVASRLRAQGYPRARSLAGGMTAWLESGGGCDPG